MRFGAWTSLCLCLISKAVSLASRASAVPVRGSGGRGTQATGRAPPGPRDARDESENRGDCEPRCDLCVCPPQPPARAGEGAEREVRRDHRPRRVACWCSLSLLLSNNL